MRLVVVATLALPLAALACTAVPPSPPVDADAPCAPAPSGALALEGVEGTEGYDEELAAIDLAALPARIPLDGVSGLQRSLVLYMLDEPELEAIDRDATIAKGPLGRATVAAFRDGALDFAFLRRGLQRFYACDRGFPRTLAEFNSTVVDVSALAAAETIDSDVKDLPRRMRRSARDGVFVAETLRDGVVRETEILLTDRRNDGAIEFIEYDEDGLLRGTSSFATSTGTEGVGPVPFSCIGCHGTRDVVPGG